MSLIRKLFGADAPAPADATKLDGTTEAALTRSLSALPPGERGWIAFAEARNLFSTERAEYAFGELDQDGRKVTFRRPFVGCTRHRAGALRRFPGQTHSTFLKLEIVNRQCDRTKQIMRRLLSANSSFNP
jgi:hypothetical protein